MSSSTISLFCGETVKDSPQFSLIEDAGYHIETCPALSNRHVFHITGRWGRSVANIFTANANPFDIFSSLAESEAGNPFLLWDPESMRREVREWNELNRKLHQDANGLVGNELATFNRLTDSLAQHHKPIILFGEKEKWKGFEDVLDQLEKAGTLRHGVRNKFTYAQTAQDVCNVLNERMPKGWDDKETADHKRHVYDRGVNPPIEYIAQDDSRSRPGISIAFFGSASTRKREHLKLAQESIKMCADHGWGAVNGGGFNGVMGEQMRTAKKAGVYLHGISTDDRNALAISGTEKNPDKILENMKKYTECKDMIHRIEYYLQDSDGIALLDGGLGSAEELFMVLELFRERHILTKYQDVNGTWHDKPFLVIDSNGTWAPIIEWAKEAYGEEYMAAVKMVSSMQDAEKIYAEQFEKFKPKLPTEVIDHHVYEAENTLKTANRLTSMAKGKINNQVKPGRSKVAEDWQSTMALVELTNQSPTATESEIAELCTKAKLQHARAISVSPQWVEKAKVLLGESDVKLSTCVTGDTVDDVINAAHTAKSNGASEIAVAFPKQMLLDKNYAECSDYIKKLADTVSAKLVLDTAGLSTEQVATAGIIAREANTPSVQLSAATVETIEIMRRSVGNDIGVGVTDIVNDYETTMAMIDAGASNVSAPAAGLSLTSKQQVVPYATIAVTTASKLPPYSKVAKGF